MVRYGKNDEHSLNYSEYIYILSSFLHHSHAHSLHPKNAKKNTKRRFSFFTKDAVNWHRSSWAATWEVAKGRMPLVGKSKRETKSNLTKWDLKQPEKTLEKPRKSPRNLLPVIFRVPIFSCNGWWLWWFPPRKNRPPDSESGVFVAGKVNVGWTYCHDAMASHAYNVAKSVKKQKRAGKNSVNDTHKTSHPWNFSQLLLRPVEGRAVQGNRKLLL